MQHQGSLHLEKEELTRQFLNGANNNDDYNQNAFTKKNALNNSIDVSLKIPGHAKNAKSMA